MFCCTFTLESFVWVHQMVVICRFSRFFFLFSAHKINRQLKFEREREGVKTRESERERKLKHRTPSTQMDGEIFALRIYFKCVCCKTLHLFGIPCWRFSQWEIEIAKWIDGAAPVEGMLKLSRRFNKVMCNTNYRRSSKEHFVYKCVKVKSWNQNKSRGKDAKNILGKRLVFWNYKLCLIHTKWCEKIEDFDVVVVFLFLFLFSFYILFSSS